MTFNKASSSSSLLDLRSSSFETYLEGEVFYFTFLLLSFAMTQVCFLLLRLGERDLLEEEEEPLIAMVATPLLSELELSSSESHSLPMCTSP
jgi:hypothetical protein